METFVGAYGVKSDAEIKQYLNGKCKKEERTKEDWLGHTYTYETILWCFCNDRDFCNGGNNPTVYITFIVAFAALAIVF